MTKRNDVHRKGAIVPAEYVYCFSYSLASMHMPAVNVQLVAALCEGGKAFAAHGGVGKCTVCGAWFIHGDVWRHEPTGEHIHVGQDCAEKYSLLADRSAYEMECWRAKKAHETEERRAANANAREAFLLAHPGLREDLAVKHPIIEDIEKKFSLYLSISDAQISLVRKLAEEVRNPPPPEKHITAPVGCVTFRGRVVSMKPYESQFGTVWKMTVKVETPAGSWLAWGTVPQAINPTKGDLLEVCATLKPGKDTYFALMSRPRAKMIGGTNA